MKLLDLVEGLLPEEEAAAVRAHVATCDGCGPAFARLSETHRAFTDLPLEEPSAAVDSAILQMARAKATGQAVVIPQESRDLAEAAPAPWEKWLRKLGGFATGPQAAMATVMLLVLAIGVWYLPRNGGANNFGESVMHPSNADEAAAPQSAAPEMKVEAAREEAAPAAAPEPTLNTEMDKAAHERPAGEGALQGAASRGELGALGGSVGGAGPAKMRSARRAKKDDYDSASPSTELVVGKSMDAEGRGMAAPTPAASTAAYAGSAREADDLVPSKEETKGAAKAAPSLLTDARTAAARGDCKTAVAAYSAFLARYPASNSRAQALAEQAACYDRLGQVAMAQKARAAAADSSPAKKALPKAGAADSANVETGF